MEQVHHFLVVLFRGQVRRRSQDRTGRMRGLASCKACGKQRESKTQPYQYPRQARPRGRKPLFESKVQNSGFESSGATFDIRGNP